MRPNREASSRFLNVAQVNRSREPGRSFRPSEGRCVAAAFTVRLNLFVFYCCVAFRVLRIRCGKLRDVVMSLLRDTVLYQH